MNNEIGQRLHSLRELKNISIYKLSKLSGVSEGHIRNLENGIKTPNVVTLKLLTEGLNISLSEFFNTDNSEATYLSEGEKKILKFYRQLPKDKADILIEFYEKMCDEQL